MANVSSKHTKWDPKSFLLRNS